MDDLKLIKDKYGEKMMHFCRRAFSTILESPGLLYSLLKDHFEFNKFLYEDIVREEAEDSFRNYINSMLKEDEAKAASEKTPKELFEELGYDFYECKTEEDIQYFKKYYIESEELCTFSGGRLNTCYVFFAVKKDAENIKRKEEPERQDEYGTSVISIQFTKDDINTLSIKNRYNHTVNNPDATFSNNLENIRPGLTDSFEKTYNLNISQNDSRIFELNGYVRANDGKYYKYNYEINNIYYCPNNIIIDNYNVIRTYEEKEKYLIFDYFILDLVNKKIFEYDHLFDSFVDSVGDIKKIDIIKDKHTQNKIIKIENIDSNVIYIEIDKTNRIISYANNYVESIGTSFLEHNTTLENLEMNNVKEIKNRFCYRNRNIKNISLNSVEKIGNNFFPYKKTLTSINLPNVREIGSHFLYNSGSLKLLNMPKLEKVGEFFLYNNLSLEYLYLPSLREVSKKFLYSNEKIEEVYLPNLQIVGNEFLRWNRRIFELDLPNLIIIGDRFLPINNILVYLNCPKLKSIGDGFLVLNKCLKYFNAPNLEEVGTDILDKNDRLRIKILSQVAEKCKEKVKAFFL
jgi:hypothetical protein